MQPNVTPPPSPDGLPHFHHLPGEQQFYTVSNADIYNQLTGIQGQLTTLVIQGSQSAREIVDHETRLRQLEKSRWPLPSLAVLISLASIIYAIFYAKGN